MNEPRKSLRFSIRDLIWLMLAVGLACGWFAQFRAWAVLRNQMLSIQDKWRVELIKQGQLHGAELAHQKELHDAELRPLTEHIAKTRWFAEMMNEDRVKAAKEAIEWERQVGLKEPPTDASAQYKAIWRTNQSFGAENTWLKAKLETQAAELESLRKQLKIKQAEYELLQATTAREEEVEVPASTIERQDRQARESIRGDK